MIQDVKALPISFYFSPDGATSFFIPKYQREYVGGGKNWDAPFNDLITIYDTLLRKRPVWLFGVLQAKGKTSSMLMEVTSILSPRGDK